MTYQYRTISTNEVYFPKPSGGEKEIVVDGGRFFIRRYHYEFHVFSEDHKFFGTFVSRQDHEGWYERVQTLLLNGEVVFFPPQSEADRYDQKVPYACSTKGVVRLMVKLSSEPITAAR